MLNKAECEKALQCLDYPSNEWDVIEQLIKEHFDKQEVKEWIPFTFDEDGMLDCPLPEVDEEILVSDGSGVWLDTWIEYEGYGLDSNIELEGLAWKPLPGPYRKNV